MPSTGDGRRQCTLDLKEWINSLKPTAAYSTKQKSLLAHRESRNRRKTQTTTGRKPPVNVFNDTYKAKQDLISQRLSALPASDH